MKHGKIAIIALFFAHPTLALEAQHTNFDIKGTSLTELMNLKITSLSGISEDSNKLPAAVYVITGDEIKRMGVTQLAETLRYAPGVEVARSGANTWSISIRGLNVSNANKILVMIDGRNVYNLLFANVQWQQQDVLLDDIDRIEIIRGPGGVIWGTNAVNGVINIITKNSKEWISNKCACSRTYRLEVG
jgi:iron complex outermembrane receptor protein